MEVSPSNLDRQLLQMSSTLPPSPYVQEGPGHDGIQPLFAGGGGHFCGSEHVNARAHMYRCVCENVAEKGVCWWICISWCTLCSKHMHIHISDCGVTKNGMESEQKRSHQLCICVAAGPTKLSLYERVLIQPEDAVKVSYQKLSFASSQTFPTECFHLYSRDGNGGTVGPKPDPATL